MHVLINRHSNYRRVVLTAPKSKECNGKTSYQVDKPVSTLGNRGKCEHWSFARELSDGRDPIDKSCPNRLGQL